MGNTASLIFYIISFFLSVMLVYLGNRDTAARFKIALGRRGVIIKPLLLVGVAIPILVAGFRQNVGTDFSNYLTEYDAATQVGSYLEISFNIIANISNTIFGSPTFMFIAFSALTVTPVILAINKSTVVRKEYRWVYWMLFLFVMFPQTFNLLRQGAAVSIGFYLIISIIESRKLVRPSHIVYLLLAVSFHASAWILVPVCFVAHLMNNTRRRSIIMFVVVSTTLAIACLTVLPQLLEWLGGAWSGYLDSALISRSVVPRSILILFILMICWKFYSVLKITNSYTALLWVGLLFSAGGLSVAYFERAGYYITLLLPLLVLVVIAQAASRRQITVINSSLCIFALAYFVGIYYLMGSSDIFPYDWSI